MSIYSTGSKTYRATGFSSRGVQAPKEVETPQAQPSYNKTASIYHVGKKAESETSDTNQSNNSGRGIGSGNVSGATSGKNTSIGKGIGSAVSNIGIGLVSAVNPIAGLGLSLGKGIYGAFNQDFDYASPGINGNVEDTNSVGPGDFEGVEVEVDGQIGSGKGWSNPNDANDGGGDGVSGDGGHGAGSGGDQADGGSSSDNDSQTGHNSDASSDSGGGDSGGGGCYITTATCDHIGKPDNCLELTVLRWFRDNILVCTAHGQKTIDAYYQSAPNLVEALNKQPDREAVYKHIFTTYIQPSVIYVQTGSYVLAEATYTNMVNFLTRLGDEK